MIKARAETDDGAALFIFGLSEGNLRLLREGRPILIDLGAMGGPPGAQVVIFYGATEEAIVQQIRDTGWTLPEGAP